MCPVSQLSLIYVTILLPGSVLGQERISPGPGTSRTVIIEAQEVSSPDVDISPDGSTIVFSMLGQLFRLPADGGEAEQLTDGRSYNEDPAFSPNGTRIAFASDRGGGEGNIFVLTLSTGEIHQVTDEFWAARPAWSLDGESLLYLSYDVGSVRCTGRAAVHRIRAQGGDPDVLTDGSRIIRSVAFSEEGLPMWVAQEVEEGKPTVSVIEVLQPEGAVKTVARIEGRVDRMGGQPTGALWVHRSRSMVPKGGLVRIGEKGDKTPVADISRHYCQFRESRFAVSSDGDSVFIGDEGKLWRVSSIPGLRDSIPFRARVELVIPAATRLPDWELGEPDSSIEITDPQRGKNGEGLLFGAVGQVFWQERGGAPARVLTTADGLERQPLISPDGGRVAVIDVSGTEQRISLRRLSDGHSVHLLKGDYFWDLAWHPSGEQLAVSQGDERTFWVLSIDLTTGEADTLVTGTGSFFFPPRPKYSQDGSQLFYTDYEDGLARILAVDLEGGQENQVIATLPYYLANIQISPGRDWIAFRRNAELWIAPLDDPFTETSERTAVRISETGGRSFHFSGPHRVVYSEGAEVWEYEILSGERRIVPVRLVTPREVAPSLLIERARLLNFEVGGFGEETSILIRSGRIEAVGEVAAGQVGETVNRLDAGGRFVIPGLIEPHMHVEAPYWLVNVDQRAYIAHGVTTVRDVGEPLHWVKSLAQRSSLTGAPLPRYLFTGEMLQHKVLGAKPEDVGYAESSALIFDEETSRRVIREHRERGVHAIKAYATLPMNLHRAVAEAARSERLPVIAHGTNVKEIVRSVLVGHSFVEHLNGPSRFHDDVHQLLGAVGTYWTPTLSIMGGTRILGAPPDFMESEHGHFFQFLHSNEIADVAGGRARGAKLLIGTDHPNPGRVGAAHHSEMEAFVLAGFSPLEILEMATRGAARALGIDGSVGTIAPGKLADLVILSEDPLQTIKNTRTIWRVVKGGWVFDPARLKQATP